MPDADPTALPTRVRFRVIFAATLMSVLLYLDRFCLSFVEKYIKEELRLADDQIAFLLSAFFWTYALSQTPTGWLTDRWGGRRMLTLYIITWSIFTGWMGLVASFPMILFLRFGCGVAQAGAYPTSAGLIRVWIPFSARAKASGMVANGGRIGGVLAPVLTAYLLWTFVNPSAGALLTATDLFQPDEFLATQPEKHAGLPGTVFRLIQEERSADRNSPPHEVVNRALQRSDFFPTTLDPTLSVEPQAQRLWDRGVERLSPDDRQLLARLLLEACFPKDVRKLCGAGWRPVVLLYGLLGILVGLFFWWAVRDRPSEHPDVNAAELALIQQGEARPTTERPPFPWREILASPSLWMISLVQLFGNIGWTFLVTWFPRYLDDVHHLPTAVRGQMTAIPLLVGMAGMFLGGWLTDLSTRRLGLRWGRALPIVVTRFTAAGAFFACMTTDNLYLVVFFLGVVAFSTDMGVPAVWAYNQDVGGKYVASILGWGNMWGNFGSALSPMILQPIFNQYGWNTMFLVCGLFLVLAGVLSAMIDARIPIAKPRPSAEL